MASRFVKYVLDSIPASKVLDLSKGPRIMLGVSAAFMAGMLYLEGPWNGLVALFCAIVAAACLFPEKIRPYFGDVIAVAAIVFCVWALYVLSENPENNPAFPIGCGLIGVVHLLQRYKFIFKQSGYSK